MSDFSCKEAGDIKNRVLRERVRYYKEDEQGVRKICKVLDRIVKEEVKKRDEEIVLNALKMNLSVNQIRELTGLSEIVIRKSSRRFLLRLNSIKKIIRVVHNSKTKSAA